MVSIRKIVTKDILKADVNTSVKDAAKLMRDKKVGCLLIEQDKKLMGIITETDIVRNLVAEERNPGSTLVSAIMNSPILTIDIEKSIIDANDMMDKNKIRHLAVTEEGKIVGVVSVRDIIQPLYMEGAEW